MKKKLYIKPLCKAVDVYAECNNMVIHSGEEATIVGVKKTRFQDDMDMEEWDEE